MSISVDLIVFWAVVLARVLVPLTIPRYPLPGVLAALILDAVDQTIFQALSGFTFAGYQGYDKALDIYYLAIAYIATLRNWTNYTAVRLGRFLFYYRLLGVLLFEVFQFRWLLLLFPNVFEYFFIFYEVYRLRWNPRRLTASMLLGVTALIWIVIKLPQEYWIHVARLDVTDMLKLGLGYPLTVSWAEILSAQAGLFILTTAGFVLLAVFIWRRLRRELPPADWQVSFEPDAHLDRPPEERILRTSRRLADRFLDQELFEKTALVSLLVIIFAHILPGIRSTDWELALAITIVIIINTLLSEWLARRGVTWPKVLRHGLVMFAVNLSVFLLISYARYRHFTLAALTNALVFVLLLTLIITLYDRYRLIYLVRFYVAFC
ncbi:MAG: hypothetical protein ACK2UJ_10685 [Candidatus Promineifilaceae bacterium]